MWDHPGVLGEGLVDLDGWAAAGIAKRARLAMRDDAPQLFIKRS